MLSIKREEKELYIINKSKFVSLAYPVFDEDSVKKILEKLRDEYSDATHVCFAYILSSPRIEKASDDGEPTGTAGKPMLELLRKKKMENILLVIVRYFGGIKLGAGGLVRAYTNSGNLVLDKCEIVSFDKVKKYKAICDLYIGSKVLGSIQKLHGELITTRYLDMVEIEFIGDIVDDLKLIYKDIKIQENGEYIKCQ